MSDKKFRHIYLSVFEKQGDKSVIVPSNVSASVWAALAIILYNVTELVVSACAMTIRGEVTREILNYMSVQALATMSVFLYMVVAHWIYKKKMTHSSIMA